MGFHVAVGSDEVIRLTVSRRWKYPSLLQAGRFGWWFDGDGQKLIRGSVVKDECICRPRYLTMVRRTWIDLQVMPDWE